MSQITYANKVTLNPQPDIADINKVTDDDMNEIKDAHNDTDVKTSSLYNYNSTEEQIGIWVDNKPIYRKYLTYQHTAIGSYTYTHNLDIDTLITCKAFCSVNGQTISSHGFRPMPYIVDNTQYFRIDGVLTNTITTAAGTWINNTIYIILEYTKN